MKGKQRENQGHSREEREISMRILIPLFLLCAILVLGASLTSPSHSSSAPRTPSPAQPFTSPEAHSTDQAASSSPGSVDLFKSEVPSDVRPEDAVPREFADLGDLEDPAKGGAAKGGAAEGRAAKGPDAGGIWASGGWNPQWDPTGKYLAFESALAHLPINLFLTDASTRRITQLTHAGGRFAGWSPKPEGIYYEGWGGEYNTSDGVRARLLPFDGNHERGEKGSAPGEKAPGRGGEALPPGAANPVWSKDGKLLYYLLGKVEKGQQARDLWSLDPGTGEKKQITRGAFIRTFSLSPRYPIVLIQIGEDAGRGIGIIDLTSKEISKVYDNICGAPCWSPDGKKIAFAGRGWILAVAEPSPFQTTQQTLVQGTVDFLPVSWSSDGAFIAYTTRDSRVFLYDLKKKKSFPLAPGKMKSRSAVWSPSENLLAFEGKNPESLAPEIWLADLRGKPLDKNGKLSPGLSRITRSFPSFWGAQEGKTKESLCYLSDLGGKEGLWLKEGSSSRFLHPVSVSSSPTFSFSPGKGRILLTQKGKIWLLQGNLYKEVREVTSAEQGAAASWVDDDHLLLIEGGKLSLVPVAGKEKKKGLFVEEEKGELVAIPPVPGGREEAFFWYQREIWKVNLQTRKAEKISRLKREFGEKRYLPSSLSLSSDGKELLFDLERRSFNYGRSTIMKILYQLLKKVESENLHEVYLLSLGNHQLKTLYSAKVNSDFVAFRSLFTSPPIFFPDGKRILFTVSEKGFPNLRAMDRTTGEITRLTEKGGIFPSFSTDGSRVLYTSLEKGREELSVAEISK